MSNLAIDGGQCVVHVFLDLWLHSTCLTMKFCLVVLMITLAALKAKSPPLFKIIPILSKSFHVVIHLSLPSWITVIIVFYLESHKPNTETAVYPDLCCRFLNGRRKIQPHNASTYGVTLVASHRVDKVYNFTGII